MCYASFFFCPFHFHSMYRRAYSKCIHFFYFFYLNKLFIWVLPFICMKNSSESSHNTKWNTVNIAIFVMYQKIIWKIRTNANKQIKEEKRKAKLQCLHVQFNKNCFSIDAKIFAKPMSLDSYQCISCYSIGIITKEKKTVCFVVVVCARRYSENSILC